MSRRPLKVQMLILGAITIIPAMAFLGVLSDVIPGDWLFGAITVPAIGIIEVQAAHWYAITAVLGIFYLVHVIRNGKLGSLAKVGWILLLFIFNIIAFPIYWYLHVWREGLVKIGNPDNSQ